MIRNPTNELREALQYRNIRAGAAMRRTCRREIRALIAEIRDRRARLDAAADKALVRYALIEARRSIDVPLVRNTGKAAQHWKRVATDLDRAIVAANRLIEVQA